MKINVYFFLHNLHIIHTNKWPRGTSQTRLHCDFLHVLYVIYSVYTEPNVHHFARMFLRLHDFLISSEYLLLFLKMS